MDKLIFREEQKYTQWWLWLILLASFVVAVVPAWYALYMQVSTGKPWGDDPVTNGSLAGITVFTTLLMTGILLLFKTVRLQTEIRDDGVHFRYSPLVRRWRVIAKGEISGFEVVKYRPVAQYGGWGIRFGTRKYGRAFNVSGNLGLRLFLKNGKTIMLGTQRKEAITYAMDKLMSGKEPAF
jgi:hypothetical protein